VAVTLTNTGQRSGAEVVQLYASDTATGVTLPAQQLIGFVRVELPPGGAKTVRFSVPLDVLGYVGLSGELMIEPGPIELSAGSSSSDIRSRATLSVTGARRSIRGAERAFFSTARIE
jgi:beta-glucosidase